MAITQAQRQQVARLPLANSDVDESGDRYALAGIVEALSVGSSNITQAQRQQLARMPIADGTLDQIGDRYALAGITQAIDVTGNLVELFEGTWLIDQTWDAFLSPQGVDGNVFAEIAGFSVGFLGGVTNPAIPVDLPASDQITFQIPLTRVNERTSFTATVYFRKQSNEARPDTARYRIDCLTTGKKIQDWTDLIVSSSIAIDVTPKNNRIISDVITGSGIGHRYERKQMIVEINTDTVSAVKGRVTWIVDNLFGVN